MRCKDWLSAVLLCVCVGGESAWAQQSEVDKARLHYKVGVNALTDGDLKTARDEFREAAQLTPKNALIWYNLAVVQAKLEESQAAQDSLRRAMDLGLQGDLRSQAEDLLAALTYALQKNSVFDSVTSAMTQPGSRAPLISSMTARMSGRCELVLENPWQTADRPSSLSTSLPLTKLNPDGVEVGSDHVGRWYVLVRATAGERVISDGSKELSREKSFLFSSRFLAEKAGDALRKAISACGGRP